MSLSKGNLGSRGGGASINKLKDNSVTFPVTNVTILSTCIFRTHAQEGYRKVLEMNNTSILDSLAQLLFEN